MIYLLIEYLRTRVSRQTISHTCVQSTFNKFTVNNIWFIQLRVHAFNRPFIAYMRSVDNSSRTCVQSTIHRVHAFSRPLFFIKCCPRLPACVWLNKDVGIRFCCRPILANAVMNNFIAKTTSKSTWMIKDVFFLFFFFVSSVLNLY